MKRAPLLLPASVLSFSLFMHAMASEAWRVASTKLSQDGFALTVSFSNDITLCELPVAVITRDSSTLRYGCQDLQGFQQGYENISLSWYSINTADKAADSEIRKLIRDYNEWVASDVKKLPGLRDYSPRGRIFHGPSGNYTVNFEAEGGPTSPMGGGKDCFSGRIDLMASYQDQGAGLKSLRIPQPAAGF